MVVTMWTRSKYLGSDPDPAPYWGAVFAKLFSCSVLQFCLL